MKMTLDHRQRSEQGTMNVVGIAITPETGTGIGTVQQPHGGDLAPPLHDVMYTAAPAIPMTGAGIGMPTAANARPGLAHRPPVPLHPQQISPRASGFPHSLALPLPTSASSRTFPASHPPLHHPLPHPAKLAASPVNQLASAPPNVKPPANYNSNARNKTAVSHTPPTSTSPSKMLSALITMSVQRWGFNGALNRVKSRGYAQ